MSLKVYKNDEIQDFLKRSSGSILFGIQLAKPTEVLTIYDAYESSALSITSITAVKYDINAKEISRTDLETDLISYDSGTAQYLIDSTKRYYLSECIYTIEFTNSSNTFKTDPFLITESLIGQSFSIDIDMTGGVVDQEFTLKFTGNIFIFWGDETTESFVDSTLLSHTYSAAEKYTARIYGDLENLTYFYTLSGRITGINNFKSGIITVLQLSNTRFNAGLDLSGAGGFSNNISITNNDIYGGITNLILPVKGNTVLSNFFVNTNVLTSLDLSNLPVSGNVFIHLNIDLTDIIFANSGNGALNSYIARETSLPPYDFTDFPTSDNVSIQYQDCNWTSTEHDNQLIHLDATGWIDGTLTIQTGNAARTSASDTAYNNLVTKGWTLEAEIIRITMDMSTPSTAGITLTFASGSISINWKAGGGDVSFVSGVELTHNYSSSGTYIAEISGDLANITAFIADNSKITQISNLETGLMTNFRINGNLFSGIIDLSDAPISGTCWIHANDNLTGITFASSGNGTIDNFKAFDCDLTGTLDFSNVKLSTDIRLYNNANLTDVTFAGSGNGILTALFIYLTSIPNKDLSVFPTSDSIAISVRNNNWTSTEHDNQLINLNATGWINGNLTILTGNTARTSASDAAYNNLITNGWTIS